MPYRIFIAYARADDRYKNYLKKMLKVAAPDGLIEIWDDSAIDAGAVWRDEIRKAIDRCHMAILLMTTDSLASDFVRREEWPRILERRSRGHVSVMPIHLRAVPYQKVKDIETLQV